MRLLFLGAFCFVASMNNSSAYSTWYGLAEKTDLAKVANYHADLSFAVFVASELLAFQLLFSLIALRYMDLSKRPKRLARAMVTVSIVLFSFGLCLRLMFVIYPITDLLA
jgi:hypothetical protein